MPTELSNGKVWFWLEHILHFPFKVLEIERCLKVYTALLQKRIGKIEIFMFKFERSLIPFSFPRLVLWFYKIRFSAGCITMPNCSLFLMS